MNTARNRPLPAEFAFCKIIIIEVSVGQVKIVVTRLFGPTGFFIGTAFWASLGARGNFRTAIRADIWTHL